MKEQNVQSYFVTFSITANCGAGGRGAGERICVAAVTSGGQMALSMGRPLSGFDPS